MDSWIYGGAIVLIALALIWDVVKGKDEGDAWHDYRPKRK